MDRNERIPPDELAELMGADPASVDADEHETGLAEYYELRDPATDPRLDGCPEWYRNELAELYTDINRDPEPRRTSTPRPRRASRARGYWINKDGTVDSAESGGTPDRPDLPQFDDVQGDYWGRQGLPGPRDMGIPDPDG